MVAGPALALPLMMVWYAAQPAGVPWYQRPPWPLPFSPLGMSLKPSMVIKLFERINNLINNPVAPAGAPPANVIAAATALQPRLTGGKLPRLNAPSYN